jgi:RHS repeat-associated protein
MNAWLGRVVVLLVIVSAVSMLAPSSEARYYDPETGRFLQEDPEAPGQVRVQKGTALVIRPSPATTKTQRLNPYAYVTNNPINFIDPYGLLERGTKQWEQVRGVAKSQLRGEAQAAKEAGLQCPVIRDKTEDETIITVAEAVADEVEPAEYGFLGTGLLNKKNQENIDGRMRQKHPDWPWAGWDAVRKDLE